MHNSYKFTANMDEYLSQLAFCRKSVVRDTSCLSRIMAEQVYFTQTLHSVVQKKCLEYLCSHREEFLKEPPSHCEMLALSKLYRYEIVIFQNPGDMPVNVTKNGFEKTVILCHVDGIHYDIVYHQSHIHALAICQSIIYDILYKGVFKLSQELDEAVTFLRQQKKSLKEIDINENEPVSNPTNSPTDSTFDLSQKIALKLTPPLPYRIAKALDPSLYRNVARDIVEEEKREAKLRYRNCGFFPGDKCQVVLSSQPSKAYNAFIQELTDNQGPVVVFVEDLGEKRTVPYSSLRHFPASRNGCRYSLSESGYVPYIDKKNKRKKANIGAGMPVPSDLNSYQANRRQHTRNWVQCSGKGMQLPPQPVEYANSIDVTSPYCSVAVGNQAIMSNPTNIPIPNSTTYFMPVINVPYPPNIGHVNFNCVPSQDPYGKDLPQDVNTLRYFYNFGVESCRMMSSVMQPQPMPYTPTVLQAESTGHVIMPTPLEHGYGTVPPTPVTPPNSHGQVIYVMNSPYPAPMCQTYPAIQPMQGYGTCPAAAQ